ncbi:MAG: hypothetical protein ACTSQJ_17275 [Promethearchaeota archaeon]
MTKEQHSHEDCDCEHHHIEGTSCPTEDFIVKLLKNLKKENEEKD